MHPEALNKNCQEIFPKLSSFAGFYLAGGTALALQIGHRISVDFDLFSTKEIPANLLDQVKKVFINDKLVVLVNNPDELTVLVKEVKVSFICYPFQVLSDLVDYQGIKLLSLKDIAASKAYAVGRRGNYKDYVDLYFILSQKHISLDEIIELSDKKYQDEFNSRLFLEQLTYLQDIGDTNIIFLKEKIDKSQIKNFLEAEIKKVKL